MGDFTLGCLLGQYDKAQSFDVDSGDWDYAGGSVGSWNWWAGATAVPTLRGTYSTLPHSSYQAIDLVPCSHGIYSGRFSYGYGRSNDAHQRWFSEVKTHDLKLWAWAQMKWLGSSGEAKLHLFDGARDTNQVLPYAGGGQHLVSLASTTYSMGNGHPAIELRMRTAQSSEVHRVLLDDFLLQVDPITIHPDHSFREQAKVISSEHRTKAGKLHSYIWGKHLGYSVPLRFLSDFDADLINWWWENRFNLAFTLNTSDSESAQVVQIVNERQPIGSRVRPYNDLWEGVLELESINRGGLIF